jgi:hypothetical protein
MSDLTSTSTSSRNMLSPNWPLWAKIGTSAALLSIFVGSAYKLYQTYNKRIVSIPSNPPPEVVVPLLVAAKQIQDQLNNNNHQKETVVISDDIKVEF